jgi:uncharacterized protein YegL
MALFVAAPALAAEGPSPTTVVDGSVSPSIISAGETSEVSLSVSASSFNFTGIGNVVLVLDESGSMSSSEWEEVKDFGSAFISSLGDHVWSRGGGLGIVQFGTTARTVLGLTANKNTALATLAASSQQGGSTCLGCGIRQATSILSGAEAGEARFMVLLTDGANNIETSTFQQDIDNSVAANIESFALGVTNEVSTTELEAIASDPDSDHVYLVSDFGGTTAAVSPIVEVIALKPNATNIEVSPDVSSHWTTSSPVATKGDVQLTDNQIMWSLEDVGSEIPFQDADSMETVTLTYTITHADDAPCGLLPVHDMIGFENDQDEIPMFPSSEVSVAGCRVTESLKITKTPRSRTSRLKAAGTVSPARPDGEVVVRLQRMRKNNEWRKVAVRTVSLSNSGAYKGGFTRPKPGTCRVKATFTGDEYYLRKTTTKKTKC